jgi:hypothetical protein
MIYEPTICDTFQMIDTWIFSDPVIYAWVYWQVQAAREVLSRPLEIRIKPDLYTPQDTVRWQMRFGLDQRRENDWSPLVIPPI